MKAKLYGYIKCSTTTDAIKLLQSNHIDFEFIDVKQQAPSKEVLLDLYHRSNLDIKKFFNTSGLIYRQLNLKEKLVTMSLDEKIDLLSQHGMLLKRVVLDTGQNIFVGPLKQEVLK